MIKRFEDIDAWKTARQLVNVVYDLTDRGYITQIQFDQAKDLADKASRQLYRFISYLESRINTRRIRENQIVYSI